MVPTSFYGLILVWGISFTLYLFIAVALSVRLGEGGRVGELCLVVCALFVFLSGSDDRVAPPCLMFLHIYLTIISQLGTTPISLLFSSLSVG